jgi:CubicO group peptidase (beta-lactamase class C family)
VDHQRQPVDKESLFDVSSLTKVAATTLAAALLVGRGALRLDQPLSTTLPVLGGMDIGRATFRQLLAHGSGLAPWHPFFRQAMARHPRLFPPTETEWPDAAEMAAARLTVVEALWETKRTHRGGQRLYSDIGFMLLGLALEQVASSSLADFCRDELYRPLGLSDLGFIDLCLRDGPWRSRQCIATGQTRPREPAPGQEGLYVVPPQVRRARPGQVDDDNAYALGGVAGHAGLFGTATDLARLGWLLLEERRGANRLGLGDVLRDFMAPDQSTTGSVRSLGFDRPAAAGESSLTGALLGRQGPLGGVGHWGFTGCSLWLDIDRGLSVALVTNRTYVTRRNVEGLRRLRPHFHDLVVRSVEVP